MKILNVTLLKFQIEVSVIVLNWDSSKKRLRKVRRVWKDSNLSNCFKTEKPIWKKINLWKHPVSAVVIFMQSRYCEQHLTDSTYLEV